MPLRIHDTLTGEKKPLTPREDNHARIYICGPTVYDYAHLGHVRCYVVYDVLVRHLRASGTRVTYVRNITDVSEKIDQRARSLGETPEALALRMTKAYHEDFARLFNLEPDIEPTVSGHLDEIRTLIATLVEKKHAYVSEGDVYFDVATYPEYGKLSHRDLSQLAAGASGRTSDEETRRKKSPADFALWKASRDDEDGWPSPWGRGKPGWHIECSAMSMRYLGETFDLHGGGLDLIFPHHENEIAQSEAATGKPFVTIWMHNGFVEVDKEKMSKSLGNFFTARDVFERVEPEAVRYAMLTMHYRAPLNLDWDVDADGRVRGFPQFEEAERRVAYIYETRRRLESIPAERIVASPGEVPPEIAHYRAQLLASLDDDLNLPVAIARTVELLRAVNDLCDRAMQKKGKALKQSVDAAFDGLRTLGEVLGLGTQPAELVLTRIRDRRARERGIDPAWVEAKIEERATARASRDFEAADRVRNELLERGVELSDGPSGTRWTMA